jgi:hypothetical protein
VAEDRGESRREFLKQAGTIAWATPFGFGCFCVGA